MLAKSNIGIDLEHEHFITFHAAFNSESTVSAKLSQFLPAFTCTGVSSIYLKVNEKSSGAINLECDALKLH